MTMTIQAGLKFLAEGKALVAGGDINLSSYRNAFKAKYGRATVLNDDDLLCVIMADEEGDGAGDVSWYLPHIKQAEPVTHTSTSTRLSAKQIIDRLNEDREMLSVLESGFKAKLIDKQGPVLAYRRIAKDFTSDELASMPIPGSKPPEQMKGESGADYATRLRSVNAVYDYYPERKVGGEKVPAGYRWNDIADGLNNENILEKERISKYMSKKTEAAERQAIPGAAQYREMTRAQLDSRGTTARDRQNAYRTQVKKGFLLHLQITRIQQDYPAVEVSFDTISDEPGAALSDTTTPIILTNASKKIIGEAWSVNSFLRINVDKALADPVQGGTYDALLASAAKDDEPETLVGDGGGVDLISNEQADDYIAQLARFVDGKRGVESLTHMLTAKGSDELLLSLADFFYTVDGVIKGSLAVRAQRLMTERDAAIEQERLDKLNATADARKALTEAAKTAADNAAQVSA